jgi:hypothetical protein
MTWNYRILKNVYVNKNIDLTEVSYSIREVYYSHDGRIGPSAVDSAPWGESLEELLLNINFLLDAFNHPIMMSDDVNNKLIEIDEPNPFKDLSNPDRIKMAIEIFNKRKGK